MVRRGQGNRISPIRNQKAYILALCFKFKWPFIQEQTRSFKGFGSCFKNVVSTKLPDIRIMPGRQTLSNTCQLSSKDQKVNNCQFSLVREMKFELPVVRNPTFW